MEDDTESKMETAKRKGSNKKIQKNVLVKCKIADQGGALAAN